MRPILADALTKRKRVGAGWAPELSKTTLGRPSARAERSADGLGVGIPSSQGEVVGPQRLGQGEDPGDDSAKWRFKWEHPRFRGKPVAEVAAAPLSLGDAQEVIAREYGFATWADVTEFTDAVRRDRGVQEFETAVEAVISGDLAALKKLLGSNRALVRARSTRRHHATMLHYVAANGLGHFVFLTQPMHGRRFTGSRLFRSPQGRVDRDLVAARCTRANPLQESGTWHAKDMVVGRPEPVGWANRREIRVVQNLEDQS
jgi:hypothetical protein